MPVIVRVCVRPKRACRGVESGVIPALFKTTSQHGIRPGVWHWSPRPSLLYPRVSAAGSVPPPQRHRSSGSQCCEDLFRGEESILRFRGFTKLKESLEKFWIYVSDALFVKVKCSEWTNYGLWIVCGISGVLGS